MAQVPTSVYPGGSPADYSDALDHLSSIAYGNQNINTHPGLMQALMTAKATPQQSQAIDQYMAGVKAQNKMTLARVGGVPIDFADDERSAMDAMGVDYSASDARQVAAKQAGLGAAGSTSSGPAPQASPPKAHAGFWDKGILHGLSRAGYDALHNPVMNTITEGYNLTTSALAGAEDDIKSVQQHLGIMPYDPNNAGASTQKYGAQLHAQRAQQMQDLGYDPNSVWSNLAFDAHGYAKTDITGAQDKYKATGAEKTYGVSADDATTMALQLMKDPKAFNQKLIADQTQSPDQVAQKLQFLNSPEFSDFAKRLGATQQTFGHQFATDLGIDPVKNSTKFNLTAAGTDLIAGFYIDPTMVAGKVTTAIRKGPIAIKSLQDTDRIASLLDPALKANQSGARARVLNGWSGMIDSTNKIRDALATGDNATAAAEYARIQKATPALIDLVPDFLGKSQGVLRGIEDENGAIKLSDEALKVVEGEPITNLAEAAKYITSVGGLTRLTTGKAAVESSYMPGAVSNWGYRQMRANMAAHTTYNAVKKNADREDIWLAARNGGTLSAADQAVYESARAAADPGVVTNATIDLKKVPQRFLPTEEDGIDISSGLIVAAPHAEMIGAHVAELRRLERVSNLAQGAVTKADKRLQDARFGHDVPDVFTGEEGEAVNPAVTKAEASHVNALERHRQALAALSDRKDQLASALRAAKDEGPKQAETWGDTLLPAERGQMEFNLRRYGSPVAPEGAGVGGWASPTAIAARTRLARARFSSLLPINTAMDLNAASTADKVRQYAKFYLGDSSANLLATQFANADLGTRKAIVQGLFDQVSHAAGLSRTDAGKEMLKRISADSEAYTHVGSGWSIAGKQVALHQGQTTSLITLPSFKALSDASARVGLYEGTVGRVATSWAADNLFNLFRIGILLRPATATRNIIEPYAKALLDGQFGQVMRARALTYSSSDQLAEMGRKLGVSNLTGAVPQDVIQLAKKNLADALESGSHHEVAIARHTLSRVEKGDLATMSGYGRTRIGSAMSDRLASMTQFYHTQLLRGMSPDELEHADELAEVLPNMTHLFGQMAVADRFSPRGATDIRDITDAGLVPRQVVYDLSAGEHPLMKTVAQGKSKKAVTRTGFDLADTSDKTLGTARYLNALHTRTYAAPETTKAAMAVLQDPERDLTPLIKALDKENAKGTAYGTYYKEDESQAAATRAITPDEVELGKRQWAQGVLNDFEYMLTNQTGGLHEKLTNYLSEHGTAPDELWFGQHVTKDDIPKQVLAPEYAASPVGGHSALAESLQDLTGRAFNQMVEGTIKRQSSMPFLGAHYLQARAEQDAAGMLEKMTEGGLSYESANTLLKGQAIRRAYARTAQMIDDPGQKTQFDIVARNLLMFPRAMQAFIRRWGGSLAADPFKARKMMLALEGSEHSGLVYRDQNGELTFTYPGSAVMRDAMAAVGKLPGFSNFAKFPVGMDMTGKLLMAAPGFDNPTRFSLSPMVNIPMRAVFSMFPEHESLWNEIDTALNGSVGASQAHQGILQSVEPSALNKLLAAGNEDERNSVFASAVTGAIAHLSAAGLAPDPSDPPNVQDAFVNRVKAQVRNQLYLRFAFGLVAPAAPSSLNENVDGSSAAPGGTGTASDYSFHLQGVHNLSDEYKSILDSAGGDVARATQIFTALHPEGLAYTVPTTGSTVNKAYLPATNESLHWMESNLPFLDKYKSVGAYFLPKATGEFDSNAYQAQMALGLRQKKSISEYYNDIKISQASNEYYKQVDIYNNLKAQAIAAGQKAQASSLTNAWTLWKADFLDKNPSLKMKFADTSQVKVSSEGQIADLQSMVKNGDVPDGLGPQVDQMTSIFSDYLKWKTTVPATHEGTAQKQAMADAVDQKLGSIAASDPRLTNLFNAVFRSIDSSLTKVGG